MYYTTDMRQSCMVYSMSNAVDGNQVIAMRQHTSGNLTFVKAYDTGGKGTGAKNVDPLMSQGSIILSDDGHFLFVVNAGSNDISSFRITNSGALILADVKHCGGFFPVSLAADYDLLYVANRGNGSSIASNVTGYRVDVNGGLTKITSQANPLSSRDAQPTCIVFNYESRKVAVSELNTNLISVFTVLADGSLNGPVLNNSSGAGPFGSVFLTNEILLVTEAGENALSSYKVNRDGTLSVISSSIPNYQAATCWVVLSQNKRFAYTSNAGTHSISTYEIDYNGHLSVSNVIYSTRDGAGAPIDSRVCSNNLYVLNGNEGSISVFLTDWEGRLIRTEVFRNTQLPKIGSQGLAILSMQPNYRC
ncbi:MAG TPA: beta-propeller fold lactonase family protein [Mobilitalea sp.]|nr:beta-propeller fold lactonase family protein [Mobilitalea sp.]